MPEPIRPARQHPTRPRLPRLLHLFSRRLRRRWIDQQWHLRAASQPPRVRWATLTLVLLVLVGMLGAPAVLTLTGTHAGTRMTHLSASGASTTPHTTGSLAATASRATATPTPPQVRDLTQEVDPLVGTEWGRSFGDGGGGGNTFPGATLPFGMVQWSPDSGPTPSWALDPGGYTDSDPRIERFSMTHLSGAGCNVMGDVPFMPTTAAVTDAPSADPERYSATFSHANEQATPGYYAVQLDSGIHVALTTTLRTGFARIHYPVGQPETLLVESGSDLRGTYGAQTTVVSPTEVTGSVTSGRFCNYLPTTYTVYFAAQFSRAATATGAWQGGVMPGAVSATGSGSGVYLQFASQPDPTLLVKVGISYVSTQNAEANLAAENSGWNFAAVHAAAHASWNTLLNRIQVGGASSAVSPSQAVDAPDQRVFYTALYHALLDPTVFSDANGQYRGFDNAVHTDTQHVQYANFSGWDIYRTQIPLLALLAPRRTSDILQSLVNDAQQGGGLPRWSLANGDTGLMVGDPSAAILAEGNAFGATQFDTRSALQVLLKGATQPGIGPGDSVERPGLSAYLADGYIPIGGGAYAPVSTSLEYYTDDYAIACFAQSQGDLADARAFTARAANWSRLFNPATGYIQPRAGGSFTAGFDPASQDQYTEGNGAQYTWMVPFDVGGLVTHMGGGASAQQRLDQFFTHLNAGPNAPYAWMGNEPSLAVPWEYDYTGAPWKAQDTIRRVMTRMYSDTPAGLTGNDDLGTMSAWYVWAALGMYPLIPGQAGFVLGSPLFPEVTLTIGSHHVRIDAQGAAPGAPYVQSLKINGASDTALWLPLSTLTQAHTLTYTLSTTPNTHWGTAPTDAPPSLATGGTPTATSASQP